MGGETTACNGLAVGTGGVARIALPAILGVLFGKRGHIVVPEGLGQYGGCGDVGKASVALHLTSEGDVESRIEPVAVDEQVVGPYGEPLHSPLHSLEGGLEDVDAVYLLCAHLRNSPGECVGADVFSHLSSLLVGHLFGVVEKRMVVVGRENHGSRKDRPGKAASPSLVTPRLEAIFSVGYFEHSATKLLFFLLFPAINPYLCTTMARQKTDILRQPIPTLLLTFALLLALLTTRALRLPLEAEVVEGVLSPLGGWIDSALGTIGGGVATALSILLGAVVVTRITIRYALSVIRSFVPMVLYVVGVCGVVYPAGSPALMLSLLMVVHATELMITSFRRSEQFGYVMRAAFWTALAVLIVPHLVPLVVLLVFQWSLWQRSGREMVAGAIMLFVPLLMASFCYWVGGKEPLWLIEEWWQRIVGFDSVALTEVIPLPEGLFTVALFGLHTLFTLVGIVVYFLSFTSMRTRARKGHLYFALLYLVGGAMLLLSAPVAVAVAVMGFASVPLLHTLFVQRPGVVSAVVYVVLVALPIASCVVALWV